MTVSLCSIDIGKAFNSEAPLIQHSGYVLHSGKEVGEAGSPFDEAVLRIAKKGGVYQVAAGDSLVADFTSLSMTLHIARVRLMGR